MWWCVHLWSWSDAIPSQKQQQFNIDPLLKRVHDRCNCVLFWMRIESVLAPFVVVTWFSQELSMWASMDTVHIVKQHSSSSSHSQSSSCLIIQIFVYLWVVVFYRLFAVQQPHQFHHCAQVWLFRWRGKLHHIVTMSVTCHFAMVIIKLIYKCYTYTFFALLLLSSFFFFL